MFALARAFSFSNVSRSRVLDPIRSCLSIARERRALALLDTRQLDDIGITPPEAAFEAGRPFWELPENRR